MLSVTEAGLELPHLQDRLELLFELLSLSMMLREFKGVFALSLVTSIKLHPHSCRRLLINVDSGVEGSMVSVEDLECSR
jgi:hypothetical protein